MEAASHLKLWELGDALDEVVALVMEAEGELTPEIESRLEEIEGAWEEKVERVALKVRELEANASAAKEEADRVAAIAHAYSRSAKGLKGYLHLQMERAGKTKIETPRARVRVQKNGRPTIRWTRSLDDLPEPFKRVKIEYDGRMAHEVYKDAGKLPDGFEIKEGSHVRIT